MAVLNFAYAKVCVKPLTAKVWSLRWLTAIFIKKETMKKGIILCRYTFDFPPKYLHVIFSFESFFPFMTYWNFVLQCGKAL